MLRWQQARENADKGAVLVLVAASMVFLIGVAAIAVDLAALRSDIRSDRLAADAAVTAGVASVDPFAGTDAQQACEVAWDYLLLNIEDEGASVTAPNCALLGPSTIVTTAKRFIPTTRTIWPTPWSGIPSPPVSTLQLLTWTILWPSTDNPSEPHPLVSSRPGRRLDIHVRWIAPPGVRPHSR